MQQIQADTGSQQNRRGRVGLAIAAALGLLFAGGAALAADPVSPLGIEVGPGPDGDGVLVTSVDPGSGAAEAGLREGDLLLRVDHRGVASSWESHRRLRFFDRGDEVDVVVLRDGVRLERRLRLDESGRRAWKAVEDDWRRQPDVRRIRASDRDRRIVIHWDGEELEEDLERLAERLDEMGEEIGRRVERAMEDVDWEVHSRHGDRRHHVEIEWDDGDVHLDRLGEIVEDSVAASLAASLHALEHVRFDVDIDLDGLERDLEHLEDELEREAERLERRFERRHRRHR